MHDTPDGGKPYRYVELLDIDTDDWEKVVRVNLFGTVAVIRAALPSGESCWP